jgi:hypothetical protein
MLNSKDFNHLLHALLSQLLHRCVGETQMNAAQVILKPITNSKVIIIHHSTQNKLETILIREGQIV